MKKKPPLSKFLRAAFFAGILLFSCPVVFAQVKIGTNPTVIEAASNLEVEASTANRQFKVNKTSGQVTLKDGTQGNNKVLTSDANGAASWQLIDAANVAAFPKGKMVGAQTNNLASGNPVDVSFASNEYAEGGVVRVGQALRVPVAGVYMVTQKLEFVNDGCPGNSQISAAMWIQRNGTNAAVFDDRTSVRLNDRFSLTLVSPMYVPANGLVSATAYANFGAVAGCTTKIESGELSVTYLP
ncbi:hypothetical protein [Dyadobacter diqingensis]|uniref:hypothetical protein n=1 Tax=Dyadobacter diqingensis TaxID=2938121 RepID=UPI0020C3A9E4|nr:hypothetical protein [Dyadobacter diqingensis]